MPAFNIEQLPDIWDLDVRMDWLVDRLIPAGGVTLLSGESGCGKSTLALMIARSVAEGSTFQKLKAQKRDVLIVDRENGAAVYGERLARLQIPRLPNLRVWGPWNKPYPEGPWNASIMEFAVRARPLIIFDSLIAFHPGSEQDASETRRYMDGYRRLTTLGATVVVLHHMGKAEGTKKYRGSSDIEAGVDFAYALERRKADNREYLRMTPFKSREGRTETLWVDLAQLN